LLQASERTLRETTVLIIRHRTGSLAGKVEKPEGRQSDRIIFGRDPDVCDVVFPADSRDVSRRLAHARDMDQHIREAGAEAPIALAEQIREVIGQTELSCSVGISDNKQRAKVATGFGKPAGIYQLTDENWMAVMGDLEVDALWGVGPKTAKKLAGVGITTVADLAATDATLLTSTFGPTTGLWILLLAKGGGDSNVSAEPWVPRSRSHVITFAKDLTDRAEIDSAVVELAQQTLTEIVTQDRVVTRVAVTVRTNTFYTRTKIRKLPSPSVDADVITQTALDLLDLFELDRPIRLLGVRLELNPPEGGY